MVSLSVRIRFAATPIEIGSRPANGSSYMISSGSSAIARASATRRAMPPEIAEMRKRRGAAQADGVELHQDDVADHRLVEIGVLAQRKGDVLEHREVGEQRAELEQHAEAPAQAKQRFLVGRIDDLAVEAHAARR